MVIDILSTKLAKVKSQFYCRKLILMKKGEYYNVYNYTVLSRTRIINEIIMFYDTEIEKHEFHSCKSPILIRYQQRNKISSSEKSYDYFIGYWYDDYKFQPLDIMLPKTSAYLKNHDEETKWVNFLLKMINSALIS